LREESSTVSFGSANSYSSLEPFGSQPCLPGLARGRSALHLPSFSQLRLKSRELARRKLQDPLARHDRLSDGKPLSNAAAPDAERPAFSRGRWAERDNSSFATLECTRFGHVHPPLKRGTFCKNQKPPRGFCGSTFRPGGAPQLLEYANSQLLEFRHYDHVLTRLLSQVYDAVSSGSGFLRRWRLAREAERLNTIQLDVRELTERVDNSIKFLSDTFAARVYRLAANRIGVPDYRNLVDQKLSTAGELYRFMMDRFHQGRAFVLELMVVVILIIELIYLFRGRM
jgi:hypothetical protein